MKKYLQAGIETDVIFGDTPITRRLQASLKDGKVILMDRHSCAVYYRNHSEVVKLRDVNIRRDKDGYYIIT